MSQTNAQLLADSLGTASTGTVPIGGIILWSGSVATIPVGYALCNGSNGTPNLQDRFVVGAGSGYAVDSTGGTPNAILLSQVREDIKRGGELPPYLEVLIREGTIGIADYLPPSDEIVSTLPPFYALCYIMRTS